MRGKGRVQRKAWVCIVFLLWDVLEMPGSRLSHF